MDALQEKQALGHKLIQKLSQTASSSVTSFITRVGSGLPMRITAFKIVNRSANKEILISTDSGINTFGVPRQSQRNALCNCEEIQVSVATGTASYDLEYTVAP